MPNKKELGENVIVSYDNLILKKFSVYENFANRDAQKYIDKLNSEPEFLKSEIERAEKE